MRKEERQPTSSDLLLRICDRLLELRTEHIEISTRVSHTKGGKPLVDLSGLVNAHPLKESDADQVGNHTTKKPAIPPLTYSENLTIVAFEIGRNIQWYYQVVMAITKIEEQVKKLFTQKLRSGNYSDLAIEAIRTTTYLGDSLFSPIGKSTTEIITSLNTLVVNDEIRLQLADLVFHKLDVLCQILDKEIDLDVVINQDEVMAAQSQYEYRQSLLRLINKARTTSFQAIGDKEFVLFLQLMLHENNTDVLTDTLMLTFLGAGDTIIPDKRLVIPNLHLAENAQETPRNKQYLRAADTLVAEGKGFIDLSHCVWKKVLAILSEPRHPQFDTVCAFLAQLSQHPSSSPHSDRAYRSIARNILSQKAAGKNVDVFAALLALEKHGTLRRIAQYLKDPQTLPGHTLLCSPYAYTNAIILSTEKAANAPQPGIHTLDQLYHAAGQMLPENPLTLAEKYFRNGKKSDTSVATSGLEIERIDGIIRNCLIKLFHRNDGSYVVDCALTIENREEDERSYLHFYTTIDQKGMKITAPWDVTQEEARWVGALELELCQLVYDLLYRHQPQSRTTSHTQAKNEGESTSGSGKKRGKSPVHHTPPPASNTTAEIDNDKKWYPERFVYGDDFSPENGLRKSVEEFIEKYTQARQNESISQFHARKMYGTKCDVYRIKWSGTGTLRIMYEITTIENKSVAVIVGAFFKQSKRDYDRWLRNKRYK